jgi:hypothetical protein
MIRVVNPGSGFHFLPILDPRIQGSKRHRIPDPDPQHCPYYMISKGSRQESLKILARELAPVQEISSQLLHAKIFCGLERVGWPLLCLCPYVLCLFEPRSLGYEIALQKL